MKLPTFFNRGRTASASDSTEITDVTDAIDVVTEILDHTEVDDHAALSMKAMVALNATKEQRKVDDPAIHMSHRPHLARGNLAVSPHAQPVPQHSPDSMTSTSSLISPAVGDAIIAPAGVDAAGRAAAIDEGIDRRDRTAAPGSTTTPQRVCPDRHLPAYTKTAYQVDHLGLLAGIAWFGEMSAKQIGRVWMPGRHLSCVRRQLNTLEAKGLIAWRWWYYERRKVAPPMRYGKLWSLTEAGMQLVRDVPTFPKRYHGPRTDVLLAHDTLTTQVLVHMIEQARVAGLSGVYIEREAQLNPPERRPIMDAVITLRTGGTPFPSNVVPWFNPPHDLKERNESSRKYAIENDRDSEQIAMIIGKAYAYQQAATEEWVKRNGQFPIPVWIVPTPKRRDNIMQAWMTAWPHGKWLITTDADLIHDRWIEYFDGRMRERRLFA